MLTVSTLYWDKYYCYYYCVMSLCQIYYKQPVGTGRATYSFCKSIRPLVMAVFWKTSELIGMPFGWWVGWTHRTMYYVIDRGPDQADFFGKMRWHIVYIVKIGSFLLSLLLSVDTALNRKLGRLY